MIRSVHVKVSKTSFTVQKLNFAGFISHLDHSDPIELDTGPFINTNTVSARVQPDSEGSGHVDARAALSSQLYVGLKLPLPCVDLNSALHRSRPGYRLDIESDHFLAIGPGIIVRHFYICTEGNCAFMDINLGMYAGGPAGAMFMQARLQHGGITFYVIRIQAGEQSPRERLFASLFMDKRKDLMRAIRLGIMLVASFENYHRVERQAAQCPLTHTRGERASGTINAIARRRRVGFGDCLATKNQEAGASRKSCG
jgi:hypothetical protein